MKKHRSRNISISDHALIRYIERIKGVSLEPIRKEILSDSLRTAVDLNGGNGIVFLGTCKVVVRDNTIATILTMDQSTYLKRPNGKCVKKYSGRKTSSANSTETTDKGFHKDKRFAEPEKSNSKL